VPSTIAPDCKLLVKVIAQNKNFIMNLNLQDLFHFAAPVTFVLMVLILIFSSISLYRKAFFMRMILHPYSIVKQKQYYRLFTSDLVHNDIMHLLLNEVMLYLMCANLEEYLRMKSAYGSWEFLFIYLFSFFSGVIITTFRHRNQFDYSSAGASGSILGCMLSFMILKPNYIAVFLPVVGGLKNIYTAPVFILLLIWNQRKRKNQLLDHELHFYSVLGGIVATFILFPTLI
jgi:membrane associated rhomboid family serine protease